MLMFLLHLNFFIFSMFAGLCDSSQKDPTGLVLEQFLNLHENMKNAAKEINALIETRDVEVKTHNSLSSQQPLPEICNNFANKNALSWVQAAVETDLSRFSLFRKENSNKGEKSFFVMIEKAAAAKGKEADNHNHPSKSKKSPGDKFNKSNAKATSSKRHLSVMKGKKQETEEEEESFQGNGVKIVASLAEKLLSFSRGWFLNYLENFLSNELQQQQTVCNVNSETTAILAQIKRVNKWLDDSFPQGSGADERIDELRKKLYAFLLDHLDSSTAS